jgi:hypothetical protein
VDVGCAADLLQQARVVRLRRGLTVDAEALGQARRDKRAAQPVLEVEPDAEIGRQRQRGNDLGGADLPVAR